MKSVALSAIVLLALTRGTAYATEQFSLLLAAPDLSALTPGTPVSISINVAGLPAGTTLDYIAATLSFNGGLFSKPVVSPGMVIPDLAAFASQRDFGIVDASYDSLASATSAQIDQGGLLFSFQVTALASGSGQFSFDFADALGTTATGAPVDGIAHGGSLPFAIIVPEPSTVWLAAAALAGLAQATRRRYWNFRS